MTKRKVVCISGKFDDKSDFVLEPVYPDSCDCEFCKDAFWIEDVIYEKINTSFLSFFLGLCGMFICMGEIQHILIKLFGVLCIIIGFLLSVFYTGKRQDVNCVLEEQEDQE